MPPRPRRRFDRSPQHPAPRRLPRATPPPRPPRPPPSWRRCQPGLAPSRRRRLSGSERRALRRDLLPWIVGFSERRPSSTLGQTRVGLDIRAALDQELDRGRMAFVRGPHQGRGSAQGFLRIHLRAVVEQHLHRLHIAGARRFHERSPSQRELLIGISAGLDQRFNDGGIAVDARQPQRCGALAVRGLGIRARRESGGPPSLCRIGTPPSAALWRHRPGAHSHRRVAPPASARAALSPRIAASATSEGAAARLTIDSPHE